MTLTRVFGRYGADAESILRLLRGNVPPEQMRVLQRVRDQVRSGRRVPDLDPELARSAEEVLRGALQRRGELGIGIDDVISLNERGFLDPDLDRVYRRDLGDTGHTVDDMPPRAWIEQMSSRADPDVAHILSLHLGRPFGRRPPNRLRRLAAIPCPATATPQRLRQLRQRLEDDVEQLGDRLGPMIDHIRGLPPELRTMTHLEIPEKYLRILSGNIGEILARPRMLNILAARQTLHPDAVLLTGARHRAVTGQGQALLFIDALIVRFTGGAMPWLDRVEIKNMRNADAGVAQLIATGEHRMGAGDFTGSADEAAQAVGDGPDAVVLDPAVVRVWRDPQSPWVRLSELGADLAGEYLIGVSGPGRRAIRTQVSKRHVIIPGGFDQLGSTAREVATEFDSLAGTVTVHQAMDATHEELFYLLATAVATLKRHHGL